MTLPPGNVCGDGVDSLVEVFALFQLRAREIVVPEEERLGIQPRRRHSWKSALSQLGEFVYELMIMVGVILRCIPSDVYSVVVIT